MPSKYGFKDALHLDEYYDLLMKQKKQQPPQQGGGSATQGQGTQQGQQGQQGGGGSSDGDKVTGGGCGSCCGNKAAEGHDPATAGGRTAAEMNAVARSTSARIVDAAQKGQGNVPAGLVLLANLTLEPAKVDWRAKLQRVVRASITTCPGSVISQYTAPNRRQAALGYGPGKPMLARMRSPVARVAVAVDTSGSMGKREVTEALSESKAILKQVGASVQFLACDAAVHSFGKAATVEQMAGMLKGGGGTDFRPVFTKLESLRPNERPQVIVFFTDAYGTFPASAPSWAKVLWVLVGRSTGTVPWGEAVSLDDVLARAL